MMSRRSTFAASSQSTARENSALGRLARRQRQRRHLDPAEAGAQRREVERRHRLVGQHRDARAGEERRDLLSRPGQKPLADAHVVAARPEVHADAVHPAGHVVSSMSGRADSAESTLPAMSSIE